MKEKTPESEKMPKRARPRPPAGSEEKGPSKEEDEFSFSYHQEAELIDWASLAPHFKRECLFFLAKDENLAEVAQAMEKDDIKVINRLLEEDLLRPPSKEEMASFEKRPTELIAKFYIVAPFVLAQLI